MVKRSRLSRSGKKVHPSRLKKMHGEYELTDIFEEIELGTAEAIVKENVEYVLKREKLLGKGMHVVVPASGLVDMTPKFVQVDFEVFKGHMDVIARGTAYGQISKGELMNLTVEVYPRG
jgi:hypothetical protein